MEQTMLQNSEQIHRDAQSAMGVRDEAILIATGQYTLRAAAANVLYLRRLASAVSRVGASMTALTNGAQNAKEKAEE